MSGVIQCCNQTSNQWWNQIYHYLFYFILINFVLSCLLLSHFVLPPALACSFPFSFLSLFFSDPFLYFPPAFLCILSWFHCFCQFSILFHSKYISRTPCAPKDTLEYSHSHQFTQIHHLFQCWYQAAQGVEMLSCNFNGWLYIHSHMIGKYLPRYLIEWSPNFDRRQMSGGV